MLSWPARFEIVHTYCNVRSAPSLTARLLEQKLCGAIVEADAEQGGWLRLTEPLEGGTTGWLLADGRKVPGLPALLVRHLPTTAPQAAPAAAPASTAPTPQAAPAMSAETAAVEAERLCHLDHYELLGVARDATEAAVRSGYKRMALKWHPDKHAQASRAAAERVFKRIADAYQTLSSPPLRAAYDPTGERGTSGYSQRGGHQHSERGRYDRAWSGFPPGWGFDDDDFESADAGWRDGGRHGMRGGWRDGWTVEEPTDVGTDDPYELFRRVFAAVLLDGMEATSVAMGTAGFGKALGVPESDPRLGGIGARLQQLRVAEMLNA